MKIHKTEKQTKVIDVVIEHYHQCDKCGETIEHDGPFDAYDCKLKLREGESYPEGEYGTVKYVEVCKNCVEELMKLLKDNGYTINEDEIDD